MTLAVGFAARLNTVSTARLHSAIVPRPSAINTMAMQLVEHLDGRLPRYTNQLGQLLVRNPTSQA